MNLQRVNREILERRFPKVLRRIEESGRSSTGLCSADQGQPLTLTFGVGDSSVSVYGRDNPSSLVGRWLKGISLGSETLYAVTGFGLGLHLESLLRELDEDSFVFVGEKDPFLLGEVLSKRDCSEILNDSRLFLGVGELDDAFFRPLNDVPFPRIRDVQPLVFSPLFSLAEDYYARFLTEFARTFEFWMRLFGTNLSDGGLLQENSLINLPRLLGVPDVGVLKNAFLDLPLILVGAGPSLDEAGEFLREARKKALVICVNTAYRRLIRIGVEPHFTVAADPRSDTSKGYANVSVDKTHLVCPYYVYPGVVGRFGDRILTWTGNNPLLRLGQERLGHEQGTSLLEQGTVSASVIDLGRLWGCRRICLVGQDMALGADGQTHTIDSFYSDENRIVANLEECRMLPGNTLETVPVDENLIIYLRTFEQLLEENPDLEVINTARQGAKIKRVAYTTFDDALKWLGDTSSADVEAVIEKEAFSCFASSSEIGGAMKRGFEPTSTFARRVFELCFEAALYCERLPSKFEKRCFQHHPHLLAVDEYAERVNTLLDRHEQDYKVLYDGRTKAELFRYLEAIRSIASHSESWERALQNKEYFWALSEGAYFLFRRLERLLSNSCPN